MEEGEREREREREGGEREERRRRKETLAKYSARAISVLELNFWF